MTKSAQSPTPPLDRLDEQQRNAFLARAVRLGHDPAVLAETGKQDTVLEVDTIEELRALLGPDDATRNRNAPFLEQARKANEGGLREAAEAYIFGNYELTAEQRTLIQQKFPMKVRAISAADEVLEEGEVWDLGTASMPVTVNVGTVTMQPGSRIEIRNTTLDFRCQTLERR